MPFKSKAQQGYMFIHHPKIAKEFAKKTDFSHLPEKVEKAATLDFGSELCGNSSATSGALFKEDMPKPIHTADVFSNKSVKPYTERPIGMRDINTAEDDTMMGRFAKRMSSRDYIDNLNLGFGTKAQRAAKVAQADNSESADLGLPHKMVLSGPAKEIPKETLKEGMKDESEHTKDPAIQAKIASDHIVKHGRDYYPKLKEAGL